MVMNQHKSGYYKLIKMISKVTHIAYFVHQ